MKLKTLPSLSVIEVLALAASVCLTNRPEAGDTLAALDTAFIFQDQLKELGQSNKGIYNFEFSRGNPALKHARSHLEWIHLVKEETI